MAISILKRKPTYFKWTTDEWRTYYYEILRTVTDTYADGTPVTYSTRTLNLPALIVNTWTRTIFANELRAVEVGQTDGVDYIVDNKLLIGEDKGYPLYYDLKPFLEAVLSYGSVLIDYNVDNKPVLIFNYTKLANAEGRDVGYSYTRRINGQPVKVVHTMVNNTYVKVVDGVQVWQSNEYMQAFELENILKLDDGASLPIYAYALPAIEEANDAYNELANNRVLSRKMILMPRKLGDSNREKLTEDKNQVPIIDKNNRVFRVYDTKDEGNKPVYIDGAFDPTPNIDELNFHLKTVGMQTGVGSKRFALDATGSIKTAEEVRSDNTEYIISEANIIGETLGTLVSELLTREFNRTIVVEVTGSKDELESVEDRDKRLLSEFQAGIITKRDYFKMRGMSDEEINALDSMDTSQNDKYTTYMNDPSTPAVKDVQSN